MKITSLSPQDTLSRVDELLEAAYFSADLGNVSDPLDETIFILLSQQTQDPVYRQVWANLRRTYPAWLDVLGANPNTLETILRPAGFGARRTAQLQALLERVSQADEQHSCGPFGDPPSDLTLAFLHSLDDRTAERFLDGLPGIGPKSARCVLSYALGRDAFAVDTHVLRIFGRLGFADPADRKRAHDPAQALVPKKMRRRLHINLVHHGRAICREQKPRCGDCVLVSFCAKGQVRVAEGIGNKPTAIDLFAGAGGLGSGFRAAGFAIVGAVESERDAAQTYRLNHPGTPVIEAEIEPDDGGADLRGALRHITAPAAILAGPPCQGYSAAGSRNPEDRRNKLFEPVARMASDLGVKAVILENVPGVKRVNGHAFLPRITKAFEDRGFAAPHYPLLASHFGVPQRRLRYVFLVSNPEKIGPIVPPEPTHAVNVDESGGNLQRTLSVLEVFAALPRVEQGMDVEPARAPDGSVVWNASTMRHSPEVVAKIEAIPRGGGPISYRRLDGGEARTIIAGHRALPVHPVLHRTISAREAAAIQGFPPSYRFLGQRGSWPLQVANCVPPPLARALGARVMEAIRVGLPLESKVRPKEEPSTQP